MTYQIEGYTISNEMDFVHATNAISEQIDLLSQNIGHLERLHGEAIHTTSTFKHTQVLRSREQYAADTDVIISRIKSSLLTMEHAVSDPSISKIDSNLRGGRQIKLTRNFREQLERYKKMEREQATRNRDHLVHMYKIACPDATDEEINLAIEDDSAGQIFAQRVMSSSRVGEGRRVLQDVTDRQNDILRIEQTIQELSRLFNEVSEMVNRQQERLDMITVAVENIEVSVEKAVYYRKKSRKRTWWIIGIIIGHPVTLSVLKSQGKL
ncbi:t-SNARE [Linderina pennispora]|uniref:t-SNARE n=1 Tax=Linderina pennispora TaxID=61395 RepID=A0A1Y1WEY5_9FUNG|nr:t-SNARE [Linderina pennispora]ORX72032.1 t-SNARE [Linderina pennispora]